MSTRLAPTAKPARNLLSACMIAAGFCFVAWSARAHGQQAPAVGFTSSAVVPNAAVPNLVRFSGRATDAGGKQLSGMAGMTFALYAQETGGAALWLETQSVQVDATGHYSVLLGITKNEGLPADVFASGQARWVGVQVAGQAEQPRVMLLTVPYAMKAGDAATIGGLPPSAFLMAPPIVTNGSATNAASTSSATPPASSNVTTTGGTVNAIPLFTTATNIQNSILTQTAATAVNVAGKLNLPATGTATATGGKASRPEDFVASAFNSSTSAAVAQTFQLQAEAAANNTATPSGTLNLLYGSGATAPTETGFKINNKGLITFATGQTFPGGGGTITGVTAGTDLTGGGTTGTVKLNLDTTKIPALVSNNTFTGTEKFSGNVGVGAGASPSGNGYTPLTVGGNTNFGTWLALSNTSTGGHTWNIISAGSGNAEGAGNIGITDLTGTSTIWLEGNTKTTTLSATGLVGAGALVVNTTAGASIIDADGFGKNAGGNTPGLRFGGGGSGEGIASNRTIGSTIFGLDFYTNFTRRMSVLQSGQVAIGSATAGAQLGVIASSNAFPGMYTQGGSSPSGSGQNGSDGMDSYAGSGDGVGIGGNGITAYGGSGDVGGSGGVFQGAPSGTGITATGGSCNGCDVTAGLFLGNIVVIGSVLTGSAVYSMDHPLDPANKYLTHAAVESSDMKTMYDGNVTTDASGQAVVELPEWFEALNRDFRYQLTVIGQFAQAIIADKIADHRFSIRTNKPNVEVCWQVTGIRQDAWAKAHPLIAESEKSARERGFYLHPELFGAPEESGIAWARNPQIMKQQKEHRLAAEKAPKAHLAPISTR